MEAPIRALIITDTADAALLLMRELQRGGVALNFRRVQTAGALRNALVEQTWDVVLSDYALPGLTAHAALQLVRDSSLELPFIIVSSTIGEDVAVAALQSGANDFLTKDNLKRLVPALHRALHEAASHRDRRQTERLLRESEERYRNLVEGAHDLIQSVDMHGRFLFVNRAWLTAMGYTWAEVQRMNVFDILHPSTQSHCIGLFQRVLSGVAQENIKTIFVAKDGRCIDVLGNVGCRIVDGVVIASQGIFRDVTQQKSQTAALAYQASHDSLTGLPNRTQLPDYLHTAIEEMCAYGGLVALLILDLDRFKEINDTLGHFTGDTLLRQVSTRLQQSLSPAAKMVRLGGDEFAVVLPALQREAVMEAAAQLLDLVRQPFALEGLQVSIGGSIGIGFYPQHGRDTSSLMRCADVAMYNAKKTGSGYAVYDASADTHSPQRLALMTELRQGLREQQLVLYYQPKIHIERQELVGVEALIRWQHPRLGTLAPDQFIPLAEVTDLIQPLTHWVIETAVVQLRAWQAQGRHTRVAVNVSARNLMDVSLPRRIVSLLEKHGIAPEQLELEITESAIIHDPARALATLEAIHALGVRVSIDDFGTGYSSLSHLRKLPVSTLKIDLSFVTSMARNREDGAIVHSIIHLGHNLGLNVIAEGVEDERTLKLLQELKCDEAQGYLVGRPMSAAEIEVFWDVFRGPSSQALVRSVA